MESPADTRARAALASPSGYIAPSGTQLLKNALNNNSSDFLNWRREPFTKRILVALQDALVHMPAELSTEDRLVQYGVTQGIAYAMQMIADPSLLWPGVFGQNTNEPSGVTLPVMDYDTSIDDMFNH